jgi:peptidoglycan hydrolase-like protein with peptidoglycan-binding domain
MSKISKMTELAKKQVGNNASKYRNWYYGSYMSGVAWCAAFISWLANQCDLLGVCFVKTDGAGCFAREGVPKGYGKWYSKSETNPKEGDLILYRYGGTYTDKYHSDHVGYVYKVANGKVYSIEGNTNGSNDTSKVNCHEHNLSDNRIHGYYRPNYPDVKTESEETEMNFRKGDKSDGVMAYKSMLITAKELGLITQSVNPDNVFGDGTLKATKQVQEKYKLEVDGIAGIKTITALNKALANEVKALTDRVEDVKQCDRNTVIAEVKQAIKTAIDNVEV